MRKIHQYHYTALNRFQQKQKGLLLAESRGRAEQMLLQKGYSHIRLSRNLVLVQQPKQAEINQLIRQLALLVQSKIPLKTAFLMMQAQCLNIPLYRWLGNLIEGIEKGYAFSVVLAQHQQYFTLQEIQLIKMAEVSGNLSVILTNIAEAREKSEKLRKKVKKILFYPLLVLGISLSLSLFLLLSIVPKFAELYAGKAQSLPLITEILFNLSHFLQTNSRFLCFALLLSVGVGLLLNRHTSIITKLKFAILQNLPLFNRIVYQSRQVFFCQNSALMLRSHIRLEAVLNSFLDKGTGADPILQKVLTQALILLKQGHRFSEGLTQQVFSPQAIQMIAIGEQTGNLSQMLSHIAEIQQQQLDYQIDILSQLLEPILMLIMGMIVGTIIVGLYLPIFDLGGMIE